MRRPVLLWYCGTMESAKNVARMFAQLLVGGLAIATIARFAAAADPFLDRFSNFPHVYALFALVLAVVLYIPSRRAAVVAALVFVLNAVPLVRYAPVSSTCEHDFSALTINAWNDLSDHDALVARLQRRKPELLWICQLDPGLLARLSALYPHVVFDEKHPEIVLLSTFPIIEAHHRRSRLGRPHIEALVETANGPMRVFGLHNLAPFNKRLSMDRNQSIARVASEAGASAEPAIVLGDFNTTMFSPSYTPLEDAGLSNARLSRGIAATWPTDSPIRIPLDHVMTTDALQTCGIETGPSFGSDHLPFEAFLRWR